MHSGFDFFRPNNDIDSPQQGVIVVACRHLIASA
jgi:hypothetical protein